MSEMFEMISEMQRIMRNFAKLTCNCGEKYEFAPDDHDIKCPYRLALDGSTGKPVAGEPKGDV